MTFNRIHLDGFSGALLAAESFGDGRAVLHGPGGCRSYHTFLSSQCYPRADIGDRERFSGQYFFGQDRIPCTYIDEDDYINGSEDKIEECLPIVCGIDDGFEVFIKSPGASLIGDNVTDAIERSGYSGKAMAIEESLISQPFSRGYDRTVMTVSEWMDPPVRETRKGTVNILGLPISSNDWREALADLGSLLAMAGIEVISSPGAGCGAEGIRESAVAEYNVIVSPEYCRDTAQYYEKEHGIPAIYPDAGAPVGFDATESWAESIAIRMGKDPSAVRRHITERRRDAYRKISGTLYSQRVKCDRFSILTDSSVLYPLAVWLYGYLGMVPTCLCPDPGEDAGMVSSALSFLDRMGMRSVWNSDPSAAEADFLFTDGHTAGVQTLMGGCTKGVDIALPSLSRVNFIPRPVYGVAGSMYLLDEIFNAA